jgi:L-alanine-DL-glutamate epimerase-like enolase superfamily enzyme
MRIQNIELIPLQIPQTYETHWANGRISVAEHIIVKVTGEDGTYGVSEAIPRPGIYGETPRSIYTVLHDIIIPQLIGMESTNLECIWEKMNQTPYNFGAKGSIDVALYDLNGKALGVSTAQLLGGPYRKEVPLCWVSGGTWFAKDHVIEEMKEKVAEGYRGVKLKAGHFEQDIALAIEIRKVVPKDFQINIDPNQLYSREQLIKVGHALSGVIDAIEEPIPAWDDVARLEFTQKFPEIAFLSDESTFTVAETQRQMKLGAIRRLGIKIPRTGYTLSKKLVHLAEVNDMPAQISTQAETDLGCAAGLQMAASSKQISLPCEIAYYKKGMYKESMLVSPIEIKDGMMILPDAPGNGVEVNWDIVNKYAVKF